MLNRVCWMADIVPDFGVLIRTRFSPASRKFAIAVHSFLRPMKFLPVTYLS